MIGLDRRTFLFLTGVPAVRAIAKGEAPVRRPEISELEVAAPPTILPLLED
jgi:hypothetical protein